MKQLSLNKYSLVAILLFENATVYIAIPLIVNPGEITTSAFYYSRLDLHNDRCICPGVFT